MRRRRPTLVLTAVVISLSLAGSPAVWAQDATDVPEDERLVLRVGTPEDMVTDSPWFACCNEWEMLALNYDMLVGFDPQDLSPGGPGLAEECVPSDDHMTWTCTLREGMEWSDGEPLTSRDVAFTYRFIIDNGIPQFRAYFPFDPTFETPDDRTLIWKATQPTFALEVPPYVYIVPEHIWGEYDGQDKQQIRNAPNTPSVGSGPFTLTEWQREQYWRMEKNERYWGDEPAVDEVVFQIYSSQEAMLQALKNGDIDIAADILPSLRTVVEGEPGIETHVTLSDWWLNLAFNFGGQGDEATNHPALQDLIVRRAIAHAVDKETLAARVYHGTAVAGDTVIRPASTYWHLDIPAEEEYAFDPGLAGSMLDDAGYVDTDGDGIREMPDGGEPLDFQIAASTDTTGAVDAGRLIKGYLEDVGIGVNLKPIDDNNMNEIWGSGDFDAYIWYWYGDPDPDYQLSIFTSGQCGGWSDGCYSDPTFDSLYEEQRSILDREERREVVYEAQRRLYEQLPGLVLAYPGSVQAYRTDRFEGWTPAPAPDGYLVFGYGPWSYINLRPVGADATVTQSSGLPAGVWIGAAAAIVIVAGIVLLARRRRVDDEI
jgi:peptide/nickel transport system substrate-binding protein